MSVSAYVKHIRFSDDNEIKLEQDSVVVFVGPNNSGKTTALNSIYDTTQTQMPNPDIHGNLVSTPNPTVKLMSLHIEGSVEDLTLFLDDNTKKVNNKYLITMHAGMEFHLETVSAMGEYHRSFGPYAPLLSSIFRTDTRITFANTQGSIDYGTRPYTHPLHHLHQRKSLRERLYKSFYSAFGVEIGLDTMAGLVVPLHVGDGAFVLPGETETDEGYLARLRSLPRLETQGDGMRSYVGILLSSAILGHKILFIDEPETFLRPPQIRQMAKSFGSLANTERQFFISTHSPDFLRGIMDSNRRNMVIVRLNRSGNTTSVSELRGEKLKAAWSDPSLRYSNGLDGVFYDKTIVCEADGDCRFYAALADALREADGSTIVRDPLFVQAGGKGGIPKIVRALRSLSVSVATVVDFDVFHQVGQFRAIVEALGSDFEIYKDDLKAVREAIEKIGANKVVDAKAAARAVLDEIKDDAESIPSSTLKKVSKALKRSQGWELAKGSGVLLLNGAARVVAERLLGNLAGIGLHVVPSGELESFVPQETEDKNAWVQKILTDHGNCLVTTPLLASARQFVSGFMAPYLISVTADPKLPVT